MAQKLIRDNRGNETIILEGRQLIIGVVMPYPTRDDIKTPPTIDQDTLNKLWELLYEPPRNQDPNWIPAIKKDEDKS